MLFGCCLLRSQIVPLRPRFRLETPPLNHQNDTYQEKHAYDDAQDLIDATHG
jgi:hypothetical protein